MQREESRRTTNTTTSAAAVIATPILPVSLLIVERVPWFPFSRRSTCRRTKVQKKKNKHAIRHRDLSDLYVSFHRYSSFQKYILTRQYIYLVIAYYSVMYIIVLPMSYI